jgi:hypothetical protein
VGVNLFVRKSFNAVALRKAVNEHLDPKIRSLRNDKTLANEIADEWATAVTRFVPRSRLSGHHLQDYKVSDGRVIWTRPARQNDTSSGIEEGDEIAYLLYEGPIRGRFRARRNGGTPYGPHKPQPHWDACVTPGTTDWEKFVVRITPTIRDWVKNNG